MGYQNALIAQIDRAKYAEIDYSGIPRLDKSFLRKATTAWSPTKEQLTIRLDEDVLDWHARLAKDSWQGPPARINRILRVVMESQAGRMGRG